MSKKRGLSIEEKKQVILQMFHETKDIYMLKDIEKLAPKRGVIAQSVKEVVQALVDDDVVHQDKIGASNFFWSFPSEAAVQLKNSVKQTEASLEELVASSSSLDLKIQQSKQGKELSESRTATLEKVQELGLVLQATQKEVAQYAESDPQRVDAMQEATGVALAAANRWLENLWSLQSWCKKRFEGMESGLDSLFKEEGMTEDMDYLP